MKKLFLIVALLAPATAFADKEFVTPDDGTTWDCGTDATVNINYAGGTFTLTGACKEVNVNGDKVKVTTDSAATVNINGSKNAVKATELGAANINGTSNKVTYKKVLGGGKKPKVATTGRGNAVTKVK